MPTITLYAGLYLFGLLLILGVTPKTMWALIVSSWFLLGAFAIAPLIGRFLHVLL